MRAGTPTEPWGLRRLPRRLPAGDSHRNLFRSLLRRAEGVPVELADGTTGTVEEVVFGPLGYDFWAVALVVALDGQPSDGTATPTLRRVPVDRIRLIDVRHPRIVVGAEGWHAPAHSRDRHDARRHGKHSIGRVVRRHRGSAAPTSSQRGRRGQAAPAR